MYCLTYFTIVTMSTIGYGDIYPVSAMAKVFVIILILVGIGVFFSTIVAVSGEFMNDRIEIFTGRVSKFEKRLLEKHVILVGSEMTNLYLAEKLTEKMKDEGFATVETIEVLVRNLEARLGMTRPSQFMVAHTCYVTFGRKTI